MDEVREVCLSCFKKEPNSLRIPKCGNLSSTGQVRKTMSTPAKPNMPNKQKVAGVAKRSLDNTPFKNLLD